MLAAPPPLTWSVAGIPDLAPQIIAYFYNKNILAILAVSKA